MRHLTALFLTVCAADLTNAQTDPRPTGSSGRALQREIKFHVLLRKENGTWKILMDADANEGTHDAVFETGTPMD